MGFYEIKSTVKKADCLIVLGCSDIKVADVAIDIYHNRFANKIIFTGGYGKITKNIWKYDRDIIRLIRLLYNK